MFKHTIMAPQHPSRSNTVPRGPGLAMVNPGARPINTTGYIQRTRLLLRLLAAQLDRVFGVDGLVGLNGPFFYQFFDLIKTAEIFTQTYQAYQLSRFVPSKPVNNIFVAVIFLNGSLPGLTACCTRANIRGTKRLSQVVVDLVLDLIYAEAIPGLVLLPTMLTFDWSILAFPPAVSFNAAWANNAVAQSRYVLVTSYVDLMTALVPHINFLVTVQLMKTLLHHESEVREVMSRRKANERMVVEIRTARRMRWSYRIFNATMFLWGFGVLAVHIHAQRIHFSAPGCKVALLPWRLDKGKTAPCGVMEINCYRLGIDCNTSYIDALLAPLEPESLTTIVFTHCSSLGIPPLIKHFPRFIALEMFNSTMAMWGEDASLSQRHHPSLHHILLFSTNMTTFPDGLVHEELPLSLQYFALYGSNLTRLPDRIGDMWCGSSEHHHHWRVVAFINTSLYELPSSFAQVPIDTLQLIDKRITSLRDEVARVLGQYKKLRFSGSHVQELPTRIGDSRVALPPMQLQRLYVENTNVSVLPRWVTSWLEGSHRVDGEDGPLDLPPLLRVSFYRSRVCDQTTFKSTHFCEPDLSFDVDAYPFDVIAAQWPL